MLGFITYVILYFYILIEDFLNGYYSIFHSSAISLYLYMNYRYFLVDIKNSYVYILFYLLNRYTFTFSHYDIQ